MENESENPPDYLKKLKPCSWRDIEVQFADYRAGLNFVRLETRNESIGEKNTSKKWTSIAPKQYDPDVGYTRQYGGIIPFSSDEDYADLEQYIAQAKNLVAEIELLIKSRSRSLKLLLKWGAFTHLLVAQK